MMVGKTSKISVFYCAPPLEEAWQCQCLSRLPCRQCGRASHYEETTVALLTAGTLVCGYLPDQLREMQLDDSYVGQVLRWKELGEQPSADFVKTQPVPLRRLIQQWEQMIVNNGILYRHYMHSQEKAKTICS